MNPWISGSVLLAVLLVGYGISESDTAQHNNQKTPATVVRVIDGDTLDVQLADGSAERVRLRGIDTPELNHRNKKGEYGEITDVECLDRWGLLSKQFVSNELSGRVVTLLEANERDRYGRLLAYIHVVDDDKDFNRGLVEHGYARVYMVGSQRDEYLRLQEEAQENNRGLWECD